jgi:SAM-dependent methyltransferase
MTGAVSRPHLHLVRPEPWVVRFAPLVRPGGTVLDLACGAGRHGRLFLARGHPVVLLDRDVAGIADLRDAAGAEVVAEDLEAGRPWPFSDRTFAAVVVVNYLHRPLLPALIASLEAAGILIYDTFALGNEAFGRPANPEHLLAAGELLTLVAGSMTVVAYEHGIVDDAECVGIKQRLCAVRTVQGPGHEPAPLPVRPADRR